MSLWRRFILVMAALAAPSATGEPVETDLPPAGTRSLFDHLFVKEVGGTPQYDIPTSFEGVLERLKQIQGSPPMSVLIPMGRSVQRFETDLKDPRALAGFSANARVPFQGKMLPALTDRLFVGYGKKSDQLEVISYNQDAARFEFQLVKDLTKAGQQKVLYAPRTFCASCHIHRVPMFPRDAWDETTASLATARSVGRARGLGETNLLNQKYLGVPIEVADNRPVWAFDGSIDQGAKLVTYQRIWREACNVQGVDDGLNGMDAIGCRARLLKLAFRYALAFSVPATSPDYTALVAKLLPNIRAVFGGLVKFPLSDLRNRNSLSAEGGYSPTNSGEVDHGALDSSEQTIALLKSRTSIPRKFDPLTANILTDDPYMYHPDNGQAALDLAPSGYLYPDYNGKTPAIRRAEDPAFLSEIIVWVANVIALDRAFYAPLKTTGAAAYDRLDAAVAKMADAARSSGVGVLAGEPLTADKVVAGIAEHAQTGVSFDFLVRADRPMPPPQTEIGGNVTPGGPHGPNGQVETLALAQFRTHCGACHGQDAAIELFPGDYSKMTPGLAAKVLRRIDWEHCKPEPNRGRMPPESSRQSICEAPSDRANMIAALRTRVFAGVAKPCGDAFTLSTSMSQSVAQSTYCAAPGVTSP